MKDSSQKDRDEFLDALNIKFYALTGKEDQMSREDRRDFNSVVPDLGRLKKKFNKLSDAEFRVASKFFNDLYELAFGTPDIFRILDFFLAWANGRTTKDYKEMVHELANEFPSKEMIERIFGGKSDFDKKLEELEKERKQFKLKLSKKDAEISQLKREISNLSKELMSTSEKILLSDSERKSFDDQIFSLSAKIGAQVERIKKLEESNAKLKKKFRKIQTEFLLDESNDDDISVLDKKEKILNTNKDSLINYFSEEEKMILEGEKILILTVDPHRKLKRIFKEINVEIVVRKSESNKDLRKNISNYKSSQFICAFANTDIMNKMYSGRGNLVGPENGRFAITNQATQYNIVKSVKNFVQKYFL